MHENTNIDIMNLIGEAVNTAVKNALASFSPDNAGQIAYGEKLEPDEKFSSLRKITVWYDPDGDIDDLDYVRVELPEENDVSEHSDAVALCLAAAKVLKINISEVDEDELGKDLMLALARSYSSLLIKKYLGGALQ